MPKEKKSTSDASAKASEELPVVGPDLSEEQEKSLSQAETTRLIENLKAQLAALEGANDRSNRYDPSDPNDVSNLMRMSQTKRRTGLYVCSVHPSDPAYGHNSPVMQVVVPGLKESVGIGSYEDQGTGAEKEAFLARKAKAYVTDIRNLGVRERIRLGKQINELKETGALEADVQTFIERLERLKKSMVYAYRHVVIAKYESEEHSRAFFGKALGTNRVVDVLQIRSFPSKEEVDEENKSIPWMPCRVWDGREKPMEVKPTWVII